MRKTGLTPIRTSTASTDVHVHVAVSTENKTAAAPIESATFGNPTTTISEENRLAANAAANTYDDVKVDLLMKTMPKVLKVKVKGNGPSSTKKVSVTDETNWDQLLSAFRTVFGKDSLPTALSIQHIDGECEELNLKGRTVLDGIKFSPSSFPGSVVLVEFEDSRNRLSSQPQPMSSGPEYATATSTETTEYAPQEEQNYERVLRLMLRKPIPITTAIQQIFKNVWNMAQPNHKDLFNDKAAFADLILNGMYTPTGFTLNFVVYKNKNPNQPDEIYLELDDTTLDASQHFREDGCIQLHHSSNPNIHKFRIKKPKNNTPKHRITTEISRDAKELLKQDMSNMKCWTVHTRSLSFQGYKFNDTIKHNLKTSGVDGFDISALVAFLLNTIDELGLKECLHEDVQKSIHRVNHTRNDKLCHLLGGSIPNTVYEGLCNDYTTLFTNCVQHKLLESKYLTNFTRDLAVLNNDK